MGAINSVNSISNFVYINKNVEGIKEMSENIGTNEPYFNLSKNGKNVIVFIAPIPILVFAPPSTLYKTYIVQPS